MKKAKASPTTVDEYLAGVPDPARVQLAKMRAVIRATLPAEATEVISYRMPAFKLDNVLVWYAAFQDHCSLFPTAAVIDQFKDDLMGYKISKGTVQLRLDAPLPVRLIKKLVKARLEMCASGGTSRKRKG